jgi:CDP-diacylglycerol---serine O-phosphatidyltransferase
MSLSKHIPNALTCGNLVCGCFGILASFEYPPIIPAYFVWAACIFDFFDGFAARVLKSHSPMGKELDSLADMVSFGVLPAVVMFRLVDGVSQTEWLPYSAFLLAIFSAIRLAKFNIDENQKDSFIGLPTPANALFITSLIFLQGPLSIVTANSFILVGLVILFSFLLVSPIPLFALKFKNFTWRDNKLQFTFGFLGVLLLITLQAAGIPFIILLYIGLSLLSGSK